MKKLLKNQRALLAIITLLEAMLLAGLLTAYFLIKDDSLLKYFFYGSSILCGLFIIISFLLMFVLIRKVEKTKGQTEITSAEIVGNILDQAYKFGGIGLVVVNSDDVVLWANDFLSEQFRDIVDNKIDDYFPELKHIKVLDSSLDNEISDENVFQKNGHYYQVRRDRDSNLFIFKDVTEYVTLNMLRANEQPVVGYITVDNYENIKKKIQDDMVFTKMKSDLRKKIDEFGFQSHSLIRSISDDSYFFMTSAEHLKPFNREKFKVVDEIRNLSKNGFTISIGVAYGFKETSVLSQLANSALNIAFSRGGDQVVVAPFGKAMVFIGGNTDRNADNNRVKTRENSISLFDTIETYKNQNILIMGHDKADFDAIGSSLGVYFICKEIIGAKNVKICFQLSESVEENCRKAILSLYPRDGGQYDKMFVDYSQANKLYSKDGLLILVDHNSYNQSMFQEVARKFNNVIIIDHHRVSAGSRDTVQSPVLSLIDITVSSVSEIITSFLQYSNREMVSLDSKIATMMLAGISLDTAFFKEKTSNLTFDAASYLKEKGADSDRIQSFLKEGFYEYKQKVSILTNLETPYPDIALVANNDEEYIEDIMIAKVAVAALAIDGIEMSFCIGRISAHEVKISARSNNTNVGLICYKMGGGGHFDSAAVTFRDGKTVDDAKELLLNTLNDYLDEARASKREENQ